MNKLSGLDWLAILLVIIGGLNWGLVGLLNNFNLVTKIFGDGTLSNIIYILIGLAAIYMIPLSGKISKS